MGKWYVRDWKDLKLNMILIKPIVGECKFILDLNQIHIVRYNPISEHIFTSKIDIGFISSNMEECLCWIKLIAIK